MRRPHPFYSTSLLTHLLQVLLFLLDLLHFRLLRGQSGALALLPLPDTEDDEVGDEDSGGEPGLDDEEGGHGQHGWGGGDAGSGEPDPDCSHHIPEQKKKGRRWSEGEWLKGRR